MDRRSAVEASHQAGAVLTKWRNHAPQVVRLYGDVAVVYQPDRMLCVRFQPRQHSHLSIRSRPGAVNQAHRDLWILRFKAFDLSDCRIIEVGHTEQNLELGVVLSR